MFDLHRAVRAELQAHQPDHTPPFTVLKARKRRRDARRAGGALAATVLAVAAVALVPSALGGGSGDTGYATTGNGTAPIAVTLEADDPDAGTVTTIRARLRSSSGQGFVDTVNWGDGTAAHQAGVAFSCPPMPVGNETGPSSPTARPAPPAAADTTRNLQHVYRTPGVYQVTITAVHGGCYEVPKGSGTGHTTVHVTGRKQPGNGPVQPTAAIGLTGVSGGALVGDLRGLDYDGYVGQAVVDFGDGTPKEIRTNTARCTDSGTTWSGSSLRVPFRHRLAPGNYRLRLTVTSNDCQAGTSQQTTITRLIRVTGSTWKDLEPPHLMPRPSPYIEDCCLPEPPQ